MADRFKLTVKSTLPDFERMGLVFARAITNGFKSVGEHAKARAVDNTPIDTSRLRGTITPVVKRTTEQVSLDLNADTSYAEHVHENFVGAPGGTIQARLKQATPEGIVGGHYLTRVVEYHMMTYRRFLGTVIRNTLRSRKVKSAGKIKT